MSTVQPIKTKEKDWIEQAMDVYREGGSDVEVCKVIKTTLKKYREMVEVNPKFKELVEYGRLMSEAWWMERARMNLNNKQFNTSLWYAVMKNRYGWTDKTENIERIDKEISDLDSVKAKLAQQLPNLLKQLRPELTDGQVLKILQESGSNSV